MANHASAEKRNRQRLKRTARNRAAKSELRTTLKKARTALKGTATGASTLVVAAASALDRAASKGIIPAKRASRVKSRLAMALRKASATAPAS
ncbi:MAG: 30S ribosomal protein S20 [Polyangiaceae bacterium]|nr:30S ribosomal protein S20 [Polyangiaceae bacterium]